jgi:hypothetical protein
MKEILNKTARPFRILLPHGKVLHLGPRAVAQISDSSAELASVQKLVEEGAIEIVGEGERTPGVERQGSGSERTHGRSKNPIHRDHGDR